MTTIDNGTEQHESNVKTMLSETMDPMSENEKPTTTQENEKTSSKNHACCSSTLEDTPSEEQSKLINSMLSEALNRIRSDNPNMMDLFDNPDLMTSHIDDEVDEGTLLHHAILRDNLSAVEYLVKRGANVNSYCMGNAPLHFASSYKVAKHLVDNDANIEVKNNLKLTPLITAYYNGHYTVMNYLLSKNADSEYLRALLGVDSKCPNNELIRKAQIKNYCYIIENCDSDD